MPNPVVPDSAQPCIWMSAGLLTYKLCDRRFDCERCPLDAALRGGKPENLHHEEMLAPGPDASDFPEDRFYTTGHAWIQPDQGPGGRRARLGLDAFAAAIIGRCVEVSWQASRCALARGETICRIDLGLGALSVAAPLRAVVADGNPALQQEPGRLVTAPYADGWIVGLTEVDPDDLDGLLSAEEARQRARLDLQRFRRRVALQLWADAAEVGRTVADGGELIADLRQMLGGPAYLDILRELIH